MTHKTGLANLILKNGKYLLLFIVALILVVTLLLFLFVYSFVYYCFTKSDGNSGNDLGTLFFKNAYVLDVLGNVNGELFEHLFTSRRNTLFGNPHASISAAVGELLYVGIYNKRCKKFAKLLDWVFQEKDHCQNAYTKLTKTYNLQNLKKWN